MRSTYILALALVAVTGAESAQSQFEVATVRQSSPPPGDLLNINVGTVRNGKLTFENASLSDCLKFAYGIVSDDQLFGPDWIKSRAVRFDIVAQAPPDTPHEQLALMLQPLLAERLKLVLHHEQKTLSHLVLTVGKNGPKLEPSPGPAPPFPANISSAGHISTSRMSMPLLALLLSRFENQIVIDQTGLAGQYRIHLEWATAAEIDKPAASIFTAIQDLGLKLQARKGSLDVLVVDQAEKIPTEN